MNRDEADKVMGELSAGFPNFKWADATIDLWCRLLADVGFREGMASAWQVIVHHKFLSPAVFMDELASIRERQLDEHRSPDLTQLALPPGEPDEERSRRRERDLAWVAKIRAELLAMNGPLARSLGKNLRPIVTVPRADQTYFEPPGSDPEPEPEPAETPDR